MTLLCTLNTVHYWCEIAVRAVLDKIVKLSSKFVFRVVHDDENKIRLDVYRERKMEKLFYYF